MDAVRSFVAGNWQTVVVSVIAGLLVLVIAWTWKATWTRVFGPRRRRLSLVEREVLQLLLADGTGQSGYVVRSLGSPPPVHVLLGHTRLSVQEQPDRARAMIAALHSLCSQSFLQAVAESPGTTRYDLTPVGFGVANAIRQ